jgi:transposase
MLILHASNENIMFDEKGAVSARWINALLEKKPARLVSVAVDNKTARIAWVLLVKKEDYRVLHLAA